MPCVEVSYKNISLKSGLKYKIVMNDGVIEIGKTKVKVLKTISEGGFGIVYLAEHHAKPGLKLALKKVITQDEERYNLTMKELKFLQTHCAPPNQHLINYYDSKVVEEGNRRHVFYILIEYGPNGTLFDLMGQYLKANKRFSEEELLTILKVVNDDILEMHQLGVVHCDIKIENLLFFTWQVIKLCDFGSVSKINIDCSKIAKSEFYNLESQFEKQTTLMYRPPEMCDLYLGYKINTQVDMWMFGCVAFTLMFFKHPFHESSKLSIVNASFFWPEDSRYSEKLENLVRNLMTPNPDLRPTAQNVKELLMNWEQVPRIELNPFALRIKQECIAKKQLQFGIPGSNQRINRPGSRDVHKGANQNDAFDFSGLDKWNKNPIANKPKPRQAPPTKVTTERPGGFNFMNFNFSNQGTAQPQPFQAFQVPQQQQQITHANSHSNLPANDPFSMFEQQAQHAQQSKSPIHGNLLQDNLSDGQKGKSAPPGQHATSADGHPISAFDQFVANVSVPHDNSPVEQIHNVHSQNLNADGHSGSPPAHANISPSRMPHLANFQPNLAPQQIPLQKVGTNAQSYSPGPNPTSNRFNNQPQNFTNPPPPTVAPHSSDFDVFYPPVQQEKRDSAEVPKLDPNDPFNIDFTKAPHQS